MSKKVFAVIAAGFLVAGLFSCHKCYQCHNQCQVCSKERPDTTLTIMVCSDKLSQQYYNEYLDSLTSPSLGWTCHDTVSNYHEEFCPTRSAVDADILNKTEGGLICSPE
ncbi:MAG TPA: hypothetical protein VG603_07835 [Chitinophagales bacterium]|nr:hypothetical protein [Chitinophagales bacterium]